MTDPKRWLDGADPDLRLERTLVQRGVELQPAPEALEQTWAQVAAQIGTPGPPGGGATPDGGAGASGAGTTGAAAGSTAAGAAATAGIGSGLVAGFAIGVVVSVSAFAIHGAFTGRSTEDKQPVSQPLAREGAAPEASIQKPQRAAAHTVHHGSDAPPASSAPTAFGPDESMVLQPTPPVAVESVENANAAPAEPPGVAVDETAMGRGVFPAEPPKSTPEVSRLREEALGVAQAKQVLSAGQPAEALGLLAAQAQRFPRGELAHEREALTIEALVRLGRTAEARARADIFVRNHPESPVSARIQALVR